MGFIKTIKRKYIKAKSFFENNLKIYDQNILITGANSGLGFSLINLLRVNNNILALTNKNQSNIKSLNDHKIELFNLNFELNEFNNELKKKILDFKPNIIINCAAVFGPKKQSVYDINYEEFLKIFSINVFSAIEIIKICLRSNSLNQVVNISSDMGSINLNKQGNYYYYRLSKTLLNSFTKNLSIDFKNKFKTYCIHPGSMKTKLNSGGILNSEYSARKIINIIAKNKVKNNGRFIDIDENNLDW
jgi:NAD(P)-dependent dehydrogenase (short-subunit alcohol dehydrogenase family)